MLSDYQPPEESGISKHLEDQFPPPSPPHMRSKRGTSQLSFERLPSTPHPKSLALRIAIPMHECEQGLKSPFSHRRIVYFVSKGYFSE